jgi:S-DNA-T family DNA segregation ATPase FtsK/SpoIIIE
VDREGTAAVRLGPVQFVFRDGYAEAELELHLGHPDASVADLATALDVPGAALSVDGRAVDAGLPLYQSGLVVGAMVEQTRPPGDITSPRVAAVLRVVGGLAAGDSVPLPAGRAVVGRGDRANVRIGSSEISREHCLLDVTPAGAVTLTDLGSRNGTDLNGSRVTGQVTVRPEDVIALGGAVLVQVLPAGSVPPRVIVDPVREARPGGRLPFSRAPRPSPAAPEPPLRAPGAPPRASKPTFSISAIISPLIMAGAMVAITRQVMYAAISGLSPLMVIVNFIEERTRGRRSVRRGVRTFRGELEQFSRRLRSRHAAEVAARRAEAPDLAEMCYRAEGPARTLWERRPGAAGFLRVSAGFATVPWQVPVDTDDAVPEVEQEIATVATLFEVPAVIDLAHGVVGVEGDRDAALAAARSLLVQAVTGSGPADVVVAVFVDADRAGSWDWVKWLPHVADRRGGSGRLIAVGTAEAEALARALLSTAPADAAAPSSQPDRTGPVLLAVVDGATLLEGRPCALRDLLAGRAGAASGIVLTDRLPALCTATLGVRPDGVAELRRLTTAEVVPEVLASGVTEPRARRLARRLARFEDPELTVAGAGLPDSLTLLPLLGLPEVSGRALLERWRDGAATRRAGAVLGVSEQGVFGIDLDDDGPHGLIAGTTGSGKSELLRTLIISLAAGSDPEHLTFALVDYKGGGALDECAKLPHAVGLVTDLDEQLSERALRCLEAELRHREHLLRDAGLSHVTDYQRLRDEGGRAHELEPMPRLAVVIDEFATLVKALPHFVDSLVSIAQRGRSLGIHLIMATQRPAGSVNDAIKNNVKLRIALRLESSGDSMDVIDNPAAAAIGGRQRGRAFYRVSAKEVLPVQTALSTGRSAVARATAPVTVEPFGFAAASPVDEGHAADGPTDLERLVAATCEAAGLSGIGPPRRPWPDPLPDEIPLEALIDRTAVGLQTGTPGLPALAVADDPDRQTQYPVGWDPAAGNLLLYGVSGYGTTSALATLALAVARAAPPDAVHLYVMDLGAGKLAPLIGLLHMGAYIGPAERERQARLVRLLRRELEARKAGGAASRPADWLVLVDNFASFISEFGKDAAGMQVLDDLERVYAEGPTVGVRFAVTGDRSGAVPGPWLALTQQKLLFRLADPGDYATFDVARTAVPSPVPGRAVVATTGQAVQLAWPGADLAEAVARVGGCWAGAPREAPPVGLLPVRLRVSELSAAARLPGDPACIPVGLGDSTLSPVGLELYEYEHALITGPPRSGRSSALCAIAQVLAGSPDKPAILALTPRRSPLRDSPHVADVVTTLDGLQACTAERSPGPLVILADDAESVDDPGDVLPGLMKSDPHVTVVAAGRSDALRRAFGHWTQTVRESRCGVLLMPDYDLDGDLLGVTLPRLNRMTPVPGRGFLAAGGACEGIQLALPDEPP